MKTRHCHLLSGIFLSILINTPILTPKNKTTHLLSLKLPPIPDRLVSPLPNATESSEIYLPREHQHYVPIKLWQTQSFPFYSPFHSHTIITMVSSGSNVDNHHSKELNDQDLLRWDKFSAFLRIMISIQTVEEPYTKILNLDVHHIFFNTPPLRIRVPS